MWEALPYLPRVQVLTGSHAAILRTDLTNSFLNRKLPQSSKRHHYTCLLVFVFLLPSFRQHGSI